MDDKTVRSIFSKHGLEFKGGIHKIAVGFTNQVFDIDNSYILKICGDKNNEPFFRRESVLYDYSADKLPAPRLATYDDSKTELDSPLMIYPKIEGDNLYNVWHSYSIKQRKAVIKQLCEVLRILNSPDVANLPKASGLVPISSWKDKVLAKITKYLAIAEDMKTLSKNEIERVRQFIADNQQVLDQQVMGLVYWDVHFDNIIVRNNEIVGLLDFERTGYESIDHVLDLVARMQRYPKKYASEYAKQFVKDEDYQDLLEWYREFYPELFAFKDLNKRLDFYDLAQCLKDLQDWPHVEYLKEDVRRASSS